MVFLGLEPGVTRWKVHTNPLSYGGTPEKKYFFLQSWKKASFIY